PDSVSWEASEYIDHPHGAGWYTVLTLITAVLATVIYIAAKDKIATGTIVVVGIIVGVFASHKPGQAKYEITNSGLIINGKIYSYGDFKSFSIIREGALSSVNLLPLKRFMPPVSAYFESGDEDKITDAIGNYLPYDDRKLDAIERLSRRLRL
ncbi:MAG: hypothetical protein ACREGG_03465, partial [Candidatus Saccharimonadales bacterium]